MKRALLLSGVAAFASIFVSQAQCLTNFSFAQVSCPVVTSPDGCPTWSGSCNSWYISHGTPYLSSVQLPNSKSYSYTVFMWGASTQGEGMYTSYNFQPNTSYDVRLNFSSSCTTTGGVYVYAMNGLTPHQLTSCGNGYPSPAGGLQIFNYTGNTNNYVEDKIVSFTPTQNYSQLWVYPYGSGSVGPSEYMMSFIALYACPSCTAMIVYNNGTIPTGTSSSGTIEAGSSAGSGGSGTVGITANQTTLLTAAQQVVLYHDFVASPGTGSFVAQVIPCDPANTVQNYTPPVDSGTLVEPMSEKNGTAISGQASVITDPTPVKLQIYPTISSGAFTITGGASDLDNAEIIVTDESGQTVYRLQNGGATTLELDLGKLGNGLYFVHIGNQLRSSTFKVIVKK